MNDGLLCFPRKTSCFNSAHAGLIQPTPAAKRALNVAIDSLRQQGYEVVDL